MVPTAVQGRKGALQGAGIREKAVMARVGNGQAEATAKVLAQVVSYTTCWINKLKDSMLVKIKVALH